ncbi:MAG: Cna B-type domain-containing protein [Clostridiales bacterium]|nr:Cna B-type domain-containing protein [Clostridiales bacterium]
MTKRITAIILAMFFALMLAPSFTYATDSDTKDPKVPADPAGPSGLEKPSDLTVVIEYGGAPLKGINIAACRVAEATLEKYEVTYKATPEFAGSGADFTDLTEKKNIALAAALDAYASANKVAVSTKATDGSGKAAFTGLAAGLYLVAQRDGEKSKYTIAPYLVAVPGINETGEVWIHDVISYPKSEPMKREGERISVSVYKIWRTPSVHPNEIKVQLFRDGEPYGSAVSLNAGNYWRYTWDSLNPNHTWTVDEIDVPGGFIKTVSGDEATGFIITNTWTPDGPPPPTPPPAPGEPPVIPKTFDPANLPLWIMLSITSAAGLVLLIRRLRASGRLLARPRRS